MEMLKNPQIVVTDIYSGLEYCVYAHYADDELFYIGSGPIARAFDFGNNKRSEFWHEARAGRAVTVHILKLCALRAEASRIAHGLVKAYLPPANDTVDERLGRTALARALDSTTLIVCSAADGSWQREYETIAQAVQYTGVSQGAISNSIAGRYPVVRGMKFRRVPKETQA